MRIWKNAGWSVSASSQLICLLTLVGLTLTACQPAATGTVSPLTQEDPLMTAGALTLELYPLRAFDPALDAQGLQPGLASVDPTLKTDAFAFSELVAADWPQRTLVYGAAARARYEDAKSHMVYLPNGLFILRVNDVALLGGTVIEAITARSIGHPVLVYDMVASKGLSTLEVVILPQASMSLIDRTTLPGLTPEWDATVQELLEANAIGRP